MIMTKFTVFVSGTNAVAVGSAFDTLSVWARDCMIFRWLLREQIAGCVSLRRERRDACCDWRIGYPLV